MNIVIKVDMNTGQGTLNLYQGINLTTVQISYTSCNEFTEISYIDNSKKVVPYDHASKSFSWGGAVMTKIM
jgi:hypothetical protein